MSDLAKSFSALSPADKAKFLARVVHYATVDARAAYVDDYEKPDGVLLREANEFVHRVSGYIGHVLDDSEMDGQDTSVMDTIVYRFRKRGGERHLAAWLNGSNWGSDESR